MSNLQNIDIITIIGATAGGKTAVATNLAYNIGAEIISADSRQVYRGMNIGTGKDLSEYVVNGKQIPYHLIDIVDAGYKYNVFEYQKDFLKTYNALKGNPIILCGGSGMYVDAVINGYNLLPVPPNDELRAQLEQKSQKELVEMLSSMKYTHNKTDLDSKKRTIRAIEIELYTKENNIESFEYPHIRNIYFEIRFDRDTRRQRITERLINRLNNGMIEEVETLINNGLTLDDLLFYGLEYKYIGLYLHNKINYDEMVQQLNIAIHHFAKRQMTWFRGMERKGAVINAIDGNSPLGCIVEEIQKKLQD